MTAASQTPTRCYATLTADESAAVLTNKIYRQEPFFFVRYGDGALECITGKRGMTCDREPYTEALGAHLFTAWKALRGGKNVYVGDWLSASFDPTSEHARYAEDYAALIDGWTPQGWLHFETLLLMRESEALVEFYRAVKGDTRRKLFMGPVECAGAAKMLGAAHLATPMHDLFRHVDRLTHELETREFDVLLYGAGMAGNIPAVRNWWAHQDRTYVNLGSAMDPLFMGRRSRRQQISPERARGMFRELL